MKKILACIAALALLLTVVGGCAGGNKTARLLAGKWEGSIGPIEFKAMEFVPDETEPLKGRVNLALLSNFVGGAYEIIPGGKADPDKLKVTYTLFSISTSRTYDFTVTEDSLTLTAEGSGASLNYTRQTTATPTTV